MSSQNFKDVILALFPPGALWRPDENTEYVYWTLEGVTINIVGYDTMTVTYTGDEAASFWFLPGDTVTLANTSGVQGALVDGTYTAIDPITFYPDPNVVTLSPEVDPLVIMPFPATTDLTRKVQGGDLLRMILGMSDNHQEIYEYLKELAHLREPLLTPYLSDLEKEYGLVPNSTLTESERRDLLHGAVYAPRSTGSADYLEDQLRNAGFDVQVHANDRSNNPGGFFGGHGGEVITNNERYDRTILEAAQEQALWSYVFFIGGDAVYDNSGRIIHVEPAVISEALQPAFREIVLKIKPVHSWAVAVINDDGRWFTFSSDDTLQTSTTKGFESEDETTGGYWYDPLDFPLILEDDNTSELLVDDATPADYLIDG